MPNISPQYLKDIEAEMAATEPGKPLVWSAVADTHIGQVRSKNEDAYFCLQEQGLWVVADGMGGHSWGDRASKAVIDDLRSFVRFDNLTENIKDLETRFLLANSACRTMFLRQVVGSTVAALFLFGPFCFFIWAGDSRIYRLRDGTLEQVTEDHSLVQERCRRGELTPEQAKHHPSANILTRAIGVHENLRVEIRHDAVQEGDRYLLCSDGLYRELEAGEIENVLGQGRIENALNSLINMALDRGGRDNITAVITQADKG